MKTDLFIEKSFTSSNLKKFFREGVLIDTAPLMILFLGHYDKINGTNHLNKFDSKYGILDYDLLTQFLSGLRPFILKITPNIFHEFYKHSQKILDEDLFNFFPNILDYLLKLNF